jgi:hypothetical protein
MASFRVLTRSFSFCSLTILAGSPVREHLINNSSSANDPPQKRGAQTTATAVKTTVENTTLI